MSKSKNSNVITNKALTKQELANKIWTAADKLRGSIDASEYKNFLLELIFYKTISEKFEKTFIENFKDIQMLKCFTKVRNNFNNNTKDDNIVTLCSQYTEKELKDYKEELNGLVGYFIEEPYLFSSWIKNNLEDFNVLTLSDSIKAFNQNQKEFEEKINPDKCSTTPLFEGIFNSLSNDLNKLGNTTLEQTKKLTSLIDIIKDIPVKQNNFDVLGYVYEFLIAKFASSAGKKGGEFYTPHEVSLLMSEIVANHLKNKNYEIKVYDSTSGSGSLLRSIGDMYKKITNNDDNSVKYYAQELNSSTCKLTKMNLIINGIATKSICVQNADTLKDDWPMKNDEETLKVDAVVSNPPYSLPWNAEEHKNDIRFEEYGIAPRSKADFAFLLHDLYHVEDGGILAIVLPHGVLFREGSEKQIREKLVRKANIKAIIGLPDKMFYGTQISTIIMILKKDKYYEKTKENNILFVDASNLYKQEGKTKKFLASHIKKIVDTVINKREILGFSKIVNFSEIVENDFNLNISRYLDNFKKEEQYDLYSTIYGEISEAELNVNFKEFFSTFPDLKQKFFVAGQNIDHFKFKDLDKIQDLVFESENVQKYLLSFETLNRRIFNLISSNLNSWSKIEEAIKNPYLFEKHITNFVFENLEKIPLFSEYDLYQILSDELVKIKEDFEYLDTIQAKDINENESKEKYILRYIKSDIDTKEKIVKKSSKSSEKENIIQDWEHQLLPKDLIASYFFKNLLNDKELIQNKIAEIEEEIKNIDETIDEEYRNNIEYFTDSEIDKNKIKKLNKTFLQNNNDNESDSVLMSSIISLYDLYNQLDENKARLKNINKTFINDTYNKFLNLSFEEFMNSILYKWSKPIKSKIISYSKKLILEYVQKLEILGTKYSDVIEDLTSEIKQNEEKLAHLLSELETENDYDLKAINKLINILK
ncbi:type I restriction-modification system subunit M [Mesomycoplasma hyorhinis]|uniref:type I restriction-modification system subunit M n=1 Tax=Mesomycoplasma hyorhinis TaxID=2100 RepID=UPI001C0418A3|nr:type I restriction-modification system subunit M [Mesomycoplasma hyorhinis]